MVTVVWCTAVWLAQVSRGGGFKTKLNLLGAEDLGLQVHTVTCTHTPLFSPLTSVSTTTHFLFCNCLIQFEYYPLATVHVHTSAVPSSKHIYVAVGSTLTKISIEKPILFCAVHMILVITTCVCVCVCVFRYPMKS